MTKLSPKVMPLRFPAFYLTLSSSKSRGGKYVASPFWELGYNCAKRQYPFIVLSLSWDTNIEFPLFHNPFSHSFNLNCYCSFSPFFIDFYPDFSIFGRNDRFSHCVGPDHWHQYQSSKCLPSKVFNSFCVRRNSIHSYPYKTRLHKYRTSGRSWPLGNIVAFTVKPNFAR